MILHIAKYELLKFYRDDHARILVFTTALLLLASIVLGIRDYHLAEQQYKENVSHSRLNWVGQTEKDPHDAAHDGTYAIKPIHSLTILDKGIQPYAGQAVHLGAHERKQSSLNQAKDHSDLFRFGEFSPNFVLLYIFPILLIFLGYNRISQEKEIQTLRLLLSQGISPVQIVMGKWLALFAQMLVLFMIFCLGIGVCYSLLDINQGASLEEWFAFFTVYFFYFVAFINLTMIVSYLANSSGQSLVTLLAFWIIITLIVPKLSTNLASRLYPFPTLQTFHENINKDQAEGLNGHNFWNEAAQVFQKQVLQEYGVETIEELPVDYGGLLLAEGEKYESVIYTKHFDLLQAQYHKQRAIFRLSGLLSPFLSVRFISMALTRSDYNSQWHFEEEAEQYRVELNTVLNMNIAENAKGVTSYKADANLWNEIPQFSYHWEALSPIVKKHLYEYANVFLWMTFSFFVMLYFSRRITVV